MTLKNLTTTLLFLCLIFPSLAQVDITDKADITWGAEGRLGKKDEFKELFSSGNHLYTLVDKGRKAELTQYNDKLKEQKTLDIDYRFGRDSYEYIKSFQLEDRLYFIYREKSRSSNMVALTSFYVNLKSMTSDFTPVEIAKVNYDKEGGLSVHPIISEDEENVMFIIDSHVYHGGPLHFDLQLFTKDLSRVWEKKDIEFKDRQEAHFSFKDFSLKEDGTFFMLGKEFPNGNSDKGSNTTVELNFVLLKISDQATSIEELVLDVPKKGIATARFGNLNDGNIVVGGLYSTDNSDIVEGAFLQYIDKESLEVLRLSKKSVNPSYLESEKFKQLHNNTSFYVRDVFVDDENNVKFVAELEELKIIATSTSGANGATYTSYDYYYYFSNLLIVSATPKGEINWITSVKKDTKTENDGGKHGSIISMYDSKNDQLSFIYRTDNPDDDGGVGKLFGKDPKLTMYTTVSSKGNVSEEVLIDHNIHDYELMPARSSLVNNDRDIVVMADKKRRTQLVGIKFK